MRYLTPRKRAVGLGSARRGTEHHWYMTVSGISLTVMVPTFVIVFGRALGRTREEVLATFATPWIAILTAVVLVISMLHFWRGAQMMIQDYWRGWLHRGLIMLAIGVAYAVMATGLFALARIAL